MREFLSTISLMASILYLYVGLSVYLLNRKSELCKIFLLFNISLAIWSFAFSFVYTAITPLEYSFWNKLSSFGWCTFPSIVLYLIMTITENKFLKYWYVKLLVILPAPIFLFMVLFLFGPNIKTNHIITIIFYTGDYLHNFLYLLLSILLLFFWGKKSKSLVHKKQTYIIVITSAIPFLLNMLTRTILPLFGFINIPGMGQIFSLVMLWGVYHAIVRYQFMGIPTSLITSKLFNELSGLTFLVNASGIIIKANNQSYHLLNYVENELVNIPANLILNDRQIIGIIENCQSIKEPINFEEVHIMSKSGDLIPFNISMTPLYDSRTQLFLGLLIIGQDIRTTKILESEITKHKLTYEKLKNSESLFRTIIEMIPFSIILTNRNDHKVLYANDKTAQFFKIEKAVLIGRNARDFYKEPANRHLLIEDIHYNRPIKERETVFKRSDGSEFLGLITMVPANYLGQDVILSCISDITEQRKSQQEVAKSEKMLKALMYSIPDMITVTDLDGNITFANNSAYTTIGYELDNKLISENLLSVIAAEDIERAKENMVKILTYNPGPVEYKNVMKNGTILNVEVNAMVLYDDKNNPNEIIYVSRNITERKQAEAKLKQNSEEIEKINKELLQMNDILKNKSIRDSLTNLYNHQYINELLEREISNSSVPYHNLCVLMLDIDHFKRVNDTFGHQVGDNVLVVISSLISQYARNIDMIGRYGGEEFIAVLPNIDLEAAYLIADSIRLSIQEYDFGLPNLNVTISVGLAQYESEDVKTFVNRADTLLYQAKRNGRNRIEYMI